LEPATFGVPIVIGPNFSHFAEATALINLGGCISISTQKDLNKSFDNLILNDILRKEKGEIGSTFVVENKGAQNIILEHI
jgi:3-deoxy-D-manno-octulosonic-acid transferase